MNVFDKYVKDNPKEMESQYIVLENDMIIDTTEIKKITEITKEFEVDGKIQTSLKKQYEFENGKIMDVPISVHKKMMILYAEYETDGTLITKFKVKKQGSGLATKYDVLAVLSKDKSGADATLKVAK